MDIKVPRFRNHWNHDHSVVKGWRTDKPNMAIPDESYSLRDLHEKYSQGVIMDVAHNSRLSNYDSDESPDDAPLPPERLNIKDPAEMQDYVERIIEPYVEKVQKTVREKVDEFEFNKKLKKQLEEAEKTPPAKNSDDDATTI